MAEQQDTVNSEVIPTDSSSSPTEDDSSELEFEVVHKGQSEEFPTKEDAMAKAKELSRSGRSSAVLVSKDKGLRMVFRYGRLDEMVLDNLNRKRN